MPFSDESCTQKASFERPDLAPGIKGFKSCLPAHRTPQQSIITAHLNPLVTGSFAKPGLRIQLQLPRLAAEPSGPKDPTLFYVVLEVPFFKCLHEPWESSLQADKVVRIFYTTLSTYLPSYN